MQMERLYLVRLFREKRWLFVVVLLFCVGQGFFHFKGVETVPFFLYGMYSAPQHETTLFFGKASIIVEEDGEVLPLSDLPGLNKDMIQTSAGRYYGAERRSWGDPLAPELEYRFASWLSSDQLHLLTERLTNDADDAAAFRAWFRRYLERTYGRPLGKISVYLRAVGWPENISDSEILILEA